MMMPVVVLHSGGMSSRQWKKLAETLAPDHVVIAPDFLGAGATPAWPEGPFVLGDEIGLIDKVIDKVIDRIGEPVALVGHSYGATIALAIARTRPEQIKAVAVYEPVLFGLVRSERDREALANLEQLAAPILTDDAQGGSEPWFEAFVDYWNGPGAWARMPTPMKAGFLAQGRMVYRETVALRLDETPTAAYAAITAPTLLLTGERSPAFVQRAIYHLGRVIPKSSTLIVKGAGHMGPLTHAEEVNTAIAGHLRI